MKHTLGPWHWVERHIWAESIDSDVCIMTEPIMNANAKLIAKAPEMYELLSKFQNWYQDMNRDPKELDEWRKDCLILLKEIEGDS